MRPYDITGIGKVTTSTDVKEVSRYSVNGQRLATPTKGLNIVKYSDGSVKKVYYANLVKNAVSVVNFLLFILWISWKNRKFASTS